MFADPNGPHKQVPIFLGRVDILLIDLFLHLRFSRLIALEKKQTINDVISYWKTEKIREHHIMAIRANMINYFTSKGKGFILRIFTSTGKVIFVVTLEDLGTKSWSMHQNGIN